MNIKEISARCVQLMLFGVVPNWFGWNLQSPCNSWWNVKSSPWSWVQAGVDEEHKKRGKGHPKYKSPHRKLWPSFSRIASAYFWLITCQREPQWIVPKRCGKLPREVLFLQDKAAIHTARLAKNGLKVTGFTVIEHPRCSPGLAPSDFFLLSNLKRRFSDGNEMKAEAKLWVSSMVMWKPNPKCTDSLSDDRRYFVWFSFTTIPIRLASLSSLEKMELTIKAYGTNVIGNSCKIMYLPYSTLQLLYYFPQHRMEEVIR